MANQEYGLLNQAAAVMGRKGGRQTIERYGAEHYSRISLARWRKGGNKGGRPPAMRARDAAAQVDDASANAIDSITNT